MGSLVGPFGAGWLLISLLLLERMLFFASLGRAMTRHLQPLLVAARTGAWGALIERCGARRGLPALGLRLSLAYRARTPARAAALGRWRDEQRRRLHAHANWLTLLAVASLLLGLSGVALGPVGIVQPWAIHAGVEDLRPNLLAPVMGLTIAVTALLAGHGFRVWADAYLTTLEQLLNQARIDDQSASGHAEIPLLDDEHPRL